LRLKEDEAGREPAMPNTLVERLLIADLTECCSLPLRPDRGELGRVAPGDCSPGAPTDPYVQDYRIRFLKEHLRFDDDTPSEPPPRWESGNEPRARTGVRAGIIPAGLFRGHHT